MSESSSTACPRCGVGLVNAQAAGNMVHVCNLCGGAWIDNVASQKIVQGLGLSMATVAQQQPYDASRVVSTENVVGCPFCQNTLRRVAVAGVDLDLCHQHGTWFDRGELIEVAERFRAQRQGRVSPTAAAGVAGVAVVAGAAGAAIATNTMVQQQIALNASSYGDAAASALGNAADVVLDVAGDAAPDLLIGAARGGANVVSEVAPVVLEGAANLATEALPAIAEGAATLASEALPAVAEALPAMAEGAFGLAAEVLPAIASGLGEIAVGLIGGIFNAL